MLPIQFTFLKVEGFECVCMLRVKSYNKELPGGPVLRTWHFHSSGLGSIPGRGTKILQAVGYGQTLKQKQNKKEKALHFKSKT